MKHSIRPRVVAALSLFFLSAGPMACDSAIKAAAEDAADAPPFNTYVGNITAGDVTLENVWVPDQAQAGFPADFWFDVTAETNKETVYVRLDLKRLDEGNASDLDPSESDFTTDAPLGGFTIDNVKAGEKQHTTGSFIVPALEDGTYAVVFSIKIISWEDLSATADAAPQGTEIAKDYVVVPSTMLVGLPDLPNLRILSSKLDNNSFVQPTLATDDGGESGEADAQEFPKADILLNMEVESMAKDLEQAVNAKFEIGIPNGLGKIWFPLKIAVVDAEGAKSFASEDLFTYEIRSEEIEQATADANEDTELAFDADPANADHVAEAEALNDQNTYTEDDNEEPLPTNRSLIRQQPVGKSFELHLSDEAWAALDGAEEDVVCALRITIDPEEAVEEWRGNKSDNVKVMNIAYLPPSVVLADQSSVDGNPGTSDANQGGDPIAQDDGGTRAQSRCYQSNGSSLYNYWSRSPVTWKAIAYGAGWGTSDLFLGLGLYEAISYGQVHTNDTIVNGDIVALRSASGMYVQLLDLNVGVVGASAKENGAYTRSAFTIGLSGSSATFRSVVNNRYLNTAGAVVDGNATSPSTGQTFTIGDLDGGNLNNGDVVTLRSNSTLGYLSAEWWGGGRLLTTGSPTAEESRFVIYRMNARSASPTQAKGVASGYVNLALFGQFIQLLNVSAEADADINNSLCNGLLSYRTIVANTQINSFGGRDYSKHMTLALGETRTLWQGEYTIEKSYSIEKRFMIGPVPCIAEAGVTGSLGVVANATVTGQFSGSTPTGIVFKFNVDPDVNIEGFFSGGVDAVVANVKLNANLTALDMQQKFDTTLTLRTNATGTFAINAPLDISAMDGELSLSYAYFCGIKVSCSWRRGCRARAKYCGDEYDIVDWSGFTTTYYWVPYVSNYSQTF